MRRRVLAPYFARRLPIVLIFVSAVFSCSEVLCQKLGDLGLAHRICHRDQTLVGCDLVVLSARTRAGQERVEYLRGGDPLAKLVVFLVVPFDPGALLRLARSPSS